VNRTSHLPFSWISDADGQRLARPLDAWNGEERGGLFHPLILLRSPQGEVLVRHRSRDFADRADDSDVLVALAELGLPAVPVAPPWQPPGLEPEPTANAFPRDAFGTYFRALRFGTYALAGRMRDELYRAEVLATMHIATSFLEPWKERRTASST
jgi:hypothetical protein